MCTGNSTEGSNPSLSAINFPSQYVVCQYIAVFVYRVMGKKWGKTRSFYHPHKRISLCHITVEFSFTLYNIFVQLSYDNDHLFGCSKRTGPNHQKRPGQPRTNHYFKEGRQSHHDALGRLERLARNIHTSLQSSYGPETGTGH